ncbi:MAG: thiol:disulfide interchange protein DsbA/DsbL [Pseudomonadota bacterium]|nr:thiol:disulfide interchange protein DsbA/DsbL [Pseudomonadota bacterium]
MTSRPATLPRFSPVLTTLAVTAMLALAACSSPEAPASATPAATAPAASTATPSAPVDTTAPPAATPAGPIVPPSGPAPIAGTHYTEIANGQPFAPGTGKIEVVEVFGYTCPACANFEPLVAAWKARLPADVNFVPVAAPFGGHWEPYAKAYYTAEAMNLLGRTHDAMFRAIHIERSLPVQGVSNEQIGAFYAKHGADAQAFASTMSSFAIDAKLKRAQQFLLRTGVDSTPTMLVNGKYRIMGGIAYDEVLRITDHLVARERAAASAGAVVPAETSAGTAADASSDS